MRLHTTLAFLSFAISVRVGATTMRGVILANELGGPPIANVQVSAVEGSNPVSSRSNGTFVLDFPDKAPGETVQLIVQKPGMVVVNEFQLQLVLPKSAEKAPLTLLLCRAAEREEMASRFYRLKSFDAIERSYRKKLEDLQARSYATQMAKEQLRLERDQAREAARGAAEHLARVQIGEASELYRQAMSLFGEGKVDEALAILNEQKLQQSAAAARDALHQVVQAYALKGQLLVSRFQFDDAREAYQAAIAIAPDDADANFSLGLFSQELNEYSEAETRFGHALELSRQKGNEAGVAATLNCLGVLYGNQNRPEQARQAYEEALEIRRRLARQSPTMHLPGMAVTLNNLAALHEGQNCVEDAQRDYDEALETFRKLPAICPP